MKATTQYHVPLYEPDNMWLLTEAIIVSANNITAVGGDQILDTSFRELREKMEMGGKVLWAVVWGVKS